MEVWKNGLTPEADERHFFIYELLLYTNACIFKEAYMGPLSRDIINYGCCLMRHRNVSTHLAPCMTAARPIFVRTSHRMWGGAEVLEKESKLPKVR